jgi:hypothetical protein
MNIATCPHSKNAYSQTAETCDFCEQAMQSDTLSEFSAAEPLNHSKPVSIFVHVLAVFSGIIGFFVAGNLWFAVRAIFLPLLIGVNYYGLQLILGLFLFVIFLVLGIIFGFVWDKGGWKLGFSLGGLLAIFWFLIFLLDVFSYGFTFDRVVGLITNTFPVLAGSGLGAYFVASYKQKQHAKDGVV